ncbi:MAG: hypothetical protein HOB82_03180 [Alphaproteobacteria bacterium]|jgi:hypothetical protein|nr:hypothetical protein [Alphaproteobacteria bacterium]
MQAVFVVIDNFLAIVGFAVFAWVILQWLVTFGILDHTNRIIEAFDTVMDPIVGPFVRNIPFMGVFLLLILIFVLRDYLATTIAPMF